MTTINLGTIEEITARIDNFNATRKWWQEPKITAKVLAPELAGEHTIPELATIFANYAAHISSTTLSVLGLDPESIKAFNLAFRQARQAIRRSVSFYESTNTPSFEGAFAEIFLLAVIFSFVLPFCGAAFGLEHASAVGAAGGAFLACYAVAKLIGLFIDGIERRGISRIERRK